MLIRNERQGVHALTLDGGTRATPCPRTSSTRCSTQSVPRTTARRRGHWCSPAVVASVRHGFDLSDLEHATEGDLLLRFVRVEQMLDAVWRSPLLTVALASGRTWGAGADLFCSAERR